MKMKKNFLNVLILIFCSIFFNFAQLFAQSFEPNASELSLELMPSKIKELSQKDDCIVEFRSNIASAEVYINGVFYGRTNLEVKDLQPGLYSVTVIKSGFESEDFKIMVKKGLRQIYDLELQMIQGSLTILNAPENSRIFLNAQDCTPHQTSSAVTLYTQPGIYNLKIMSFGYEDYVAQVTVNPYEETQLPLELQIAQPCVSNFAVDKNLINPDYKGKLGSCSISFDVNSDFPVTVRISDGDERVVWEKSLNNFTTWNQILTWDGKSSDSKTLPDGTYSVQLIYDCGADCTTTLGGVNEITGGVENIAVSINRKITYPLYNANSTGSGVGTLPAVFGDRFNGLAVFANAGAITTSKNKFYAAVLNTGVIWNFAHHFELSGRLTTLPGLATDATFAGILNANLKYSASLSINPMWQFNYGVLLRAGATTTPIFYPYAIDSGVGYGLAALLSFDYSIFNFGYSGQFVYSPTTSKFADSNSIIKNALTATVKPVKSLSISLWVAVTSGLNGAGVSSVTSKSFTTTSGSSSVTSELKAPGAFSTTSQSFTTTSGNLTTTSGQKAPGSSSATSGLSLIWMPFTSAILLESKIEANIIPQEQTYFSFELGLSYLF